jgi:hypothetical protein
VVKTKVRIYVKKIKNNKTLYQREYCTIKYSVKYTIHKNIYYYSEIPN